MGKLLVQDRPLVRAKSDIDVVQKMRDKYFLSNHREEIVHMETF